MNPTVPADPRDDATIRREQEMVGLGHALATGMGVMIVTLVAAAFSVAFLLGLFVGWLVFA